MELCRELKGANNNLKLIETGELNGCLYGIWETIIDIPNCPKYLWQCDIKWDFTHSIEDAWTEIKEISNEVKTYTARELYNSYCDSVGTDSDVYDFLQQIGIYVDEGLLEGQTSICIKNHSTNNGSIRSIWFDGNPIMLWLGYNNALYITDKERFTQMKIYALDFMEIDYPVIPLNTPYLKYYGEETFLCEVIN